MIKNLLKKQPKKYAIYGVLIVAMAALLLGTLISRSVSAQKGGGSGVSGQKPNLVPISLPASQFAESINARDLPVIDRIRPVSPKLPEFSEKNKTNTKQIRKGFVPGTGAKPDGALQSSVPNAPAVIPGPSLQFAGRSGATAGVAPPDTVGDIGPNHYVQATNDSGGTVIQIFNPTTGASVAGPFTLGSLFPGGSFANLNGNGDPIVLYDQIADRWLIAEFAFTGDGTTPPYHMSIVISKTADPTGTYFLYDFTLPGTEFPDYPHFGVWPDGYYMSTNQFNNGGPFDGAGAFAFNRAKMIAGDPTANLIYFNLNLASFPEAIGGMLPSDADGLIPPPAGAPNVFMYFTATEFTDPADGIRAFNFTANFTTPASSTFTERTESTLAAPIPVAAFDPISPSGRADVPQLGGEGLDSISDRFMHRLQYRNFGTHEAWATSHTVDASGNPAAATFRAAPRYYELRRNLGNANPISVNNQATFSPDTTHRWMGSAAMDNSGNLAVGYSASSTTIRPEIRWAGRLFGTAAGLGEGEATVFAGAGSQTSTFNRWGDYSSMTVDPDNDCAFWYTQEHYDTTSSFNWRTRIGTFTFPSCVSPAQGTVSGQITICSGGPLANALVTFTGGPSSGFSVATDAAGNFSRQLAPGTYTVTVTAPTFGTITGMVTVTDGGTATFSNCLAGAPSIVSAGATLVTESCTPPNGAVDPNETVTISFCVQNTGGGNTANLVGTLQNTGGVNAASGPQNYGVVVAGGPPVCRNFTFTATGTCGGTITASIQFQDGAVNLGTVTYTFTLGVENVIFTENFDGVTAPALPAGWSTATTNGDGDCTVGGALCTLGTNWTTVSSTSDTAPNSAFHNDPSCVTNNTLDTPSIAVSSATSRLTFRNSFNLESTFDGGVLEISIGAGPFTDILAAGGSFVSGGYNGTISTAFLSPIAGRQAWTGNSAGFITTTVNLPAAANGQNVVLRFRFASDCSVSGTGWNIDTIRVTGGFVCCITAGACTSITCPANVTVSNDPNQCGAVVNYPPPTAVGTCGTITCSPASGSFFPVGTTTVTCTASAVSRPSPNSDRPSGACAPQTITHSASQAIIPLNSVSCNSPLGHTDNFYYRAFNLPAFGIGTGFEVQSIDIGIEEATAGITAASKGGPPNASGKASISKKTSPARPSGGSQPVTVNIYTSSMAFPAGFPGSLTLIGTASIMVADQSGTILNVPITGTAPAGSELVVEVFTPNGQATGNFFFIGSNSAGETGPSYLRAPDCGITAPTPTGSIGFPEMQIVMNVNGCVQGAVGGTTCTFTVTVNDTQPPSITCPANVVAVAAPACPANSGTTVTYPPPTASDNCPGVTVACVPPSGTVFPIGTSTVTCTATDASGNTATCSFSVRIFNVCVQDRANPAAVLAWNTTTGEYIFCCNGSTFTGVGKVRRLGCTYTLDHTPAGRRVTGKVDFTTFRGEGALQVPLGENRCTISDDDVRNNDCSCIGGGGGPLAPNN
jgi:hypothetical protein